MSKHDKAKARLYSKAKDYTYTEVKRLLPQLGFEEYSGGKTSGSRVKYFRESDSTVIMLHKPHPSDVMSPGAVKYLADYLTDLGELP